MELAAGYKLTAVGVLPEEWAVKSIGELYLISAGGDFKPDHASDFSDDVYQYPVYSNALTDAGFYGYCDYADHKADSVTVTARGMIGSANFRDHPFTAIGRVLVLEPRAPQDGRFAVAYINERMNIAVESTGVPQLTAPQFSKYLLPVPPLPEQRAIAAALGDVDGLIGALEALIAKKRDIKQAAMQQLLTGKTRLPGFKGEWDDLTFGEIFQFLRNGSNSRAQLSSNGDVGYVHYGDVHAAATGFMNCAQGEIPRIASGLVQGLPRVRDGDLIIADASEDYAGVGKSVEVTGIGNDEVVAGLHTILLRGDPTMIADGFKGYLQEIPAVKTALIRIANGISVYGISKSGVKGVSVRLPSPAEQTAIASVLSDMDAEIAALEARRDKTRALKQGMMQELLTGRIRLV